MTDDREAQVRKLAEQIRGIPLASEYPEIVARSLYDAGARIPDSPPKVALPVVSERAKKAYSAAHFANNPLGHAHEAGLRAAFADILEDTLAAVQKADRDGIEGYVVFRSPRYVGGAIPPEAVLATLTGKAP